MRAGLSPTAKNNALNTDTAVMAPMTNKVSCHHFFGTIQRATGRQFHEAVDGLLLP